MLLVGYLLGMDEKFNLCSRSVDNTKILCKTILDYEFKTSLACNVQEAREMSRGILESIRPYIPVIRWDPYYKYLLKIIEVDHSQVVLSFSSKLVLFCLEVTLQYLLRVACIASLLNYLLRRSLLKAQRKKQEIAKYLSEQYALCLADSVGNPIRSSLYLPQTCTRSV